LTFHPGRLKFASQILRLGPCLSRVTQKITVLIFMACHMTRGGGLELLSGSLKQRRDLFFSSTFNIGTAMTNIRFLKSENWLTAHKR
jgi:hypothetical protein